MVNIWIIRIVNVRKKLINSLIGECTENDDQIKIVNITVENENNYEFGSYIVYIVLMIVDFTILLQLLFI